MLHQFLSDPIIAYLWEHCFIKEKAHRILELLREAHDHSEAGRVRYYNFMQQILTAESDFNIKILPPAAREETFMPRFICKCGLVTRFEVTNVTVPSYSP